jgi:hypothetical protein
VAVEVGGVLADRALHHPLVHLLDERLLGLLMRFADGHLPIHTSQPGRTLPDCHPCQGWYDQSVIAQVMNRHKSTISRAMSFAARVHTLTTDNGKECAQHGRIAKELAADCHFAPPYAAGERDANKDMAGLDLRAPRHPGGSP